MSVNARRTTAADSPRRNRRHGPRRPGRTVPLGLNALVQLLAEYDATEIYRNAYDDRVYFFRGSERRPTPFSQTEAESFAFVDAAFGRVGFAKNSGPRRVATQLGDTVFLAFREPKQTGIAWCLYRAAPPTE